MPPKPQVFKTPDGREFSTRAEWRNYMVLTFYSWKDKKNEPEPLIKLPGSVDGQAFSIEDCENCTLLLLDHSEQVQIDRIKNCRVLIAACCSSVFIRNCEDCTFYTCSQQLRLRECFRCNFYVFSVAEVHIELSNNTKFGPFRGGYPEHAEHLKKAHLDTKQNLWYDIFDHNDPLKTRVNWSLIEPSLYEERWFPLGPCEPAVVETAAGSVDRSGIVDSNMVSFGMEQLIVDAKSAVPLATTSLPVADSATTVPVPPSSETIAVTPLSEIVPIPPTVVETSVAETNITQSLPEVSGSAVPPVPPS